MKRILTLSLVGLMVGLLAAAPASAGRHYNKVKGEVVQIQERVRTANGGEFDQLTIRTRNQLRIHLDLGPGGACEGCYQIGDRVRARVRASEGPQGVFKVEALRLRHGGQQFHYVNQGGKLVPGRRGGRPGVGSHSRDRDRIHQPGSGQGRGGGTNRRGGGR